MEEDGLYFKHFSGKQFFLIILPFFLIGSTYLAFEFFVSLWGLKLGYLFGFIFYWLVWGIVIPIIFKGFKGILSLFERPIKKKHQ